MSYWLAADGGPEQDDLPFLHRDHCDMLQNARLFRKPVSLKNGDGKFERGGKRPTSIPRDRLSSFIRTILSQKNFKPSQLPKAPANARAIADAITVWESHWFFGGVIKTDSKWWDHECHGGLDSAEGKGETPLGFIKGIVANQRQQYTKKTKKAVLDATPPPPPISPVTITSVVGGNVEGINVTGNHSTISVTNHTSTTSTDVNDSCLHAEVGSAHGDTDSDDEAALEAELELLRYPTTLLIVVIVCECVCYHVCTTVCVCVCA